MSTYETGQNASFRAGAASVVAAAGTGLFFVIEGSASKEVVVKKITISGPTLTAVAYNSYVVSKYGTAAASGGTPVALDKVPLDSKYVAATATTCQVYTAAPTAGTPVGIIASRRVLLQSTTAAAGGIPDTVTIDFTDLDGGGVVLRGVLEGVGVAFATNPASAVTLGVDVEWDEVGGRTFAA